MTYKELVVRIGIYQQEQHDAHLNDAALPRYKAVERNLGKSGRRRVQYLVAKICTFLDMGDYRFTVAVLSHGVDLVPKS